MFDTSMEGAVATVRMNVGAVNAMDRDALDALLATFQQIDADPAVHAVVLTGNDRAFCAGVDLRRILDGGEEYTRPFVEVLGRAILAPLRVHQPVVAAVNGHAVALGALLAAACDHVVCTDDPRARIGLAELNVGVAFPTGAIEVARRRLGVNLGRAVWLAELFGAEDALRLGFVDEVVPADQVLSRATEIATGLGAVPATTRQLTHEQLVRDVEDAIASRGPDWDRRVADLWCSDEGRAAVRGFVGRTLS